MKEAKKLNVYQRRYLNERLVSLRWRKDFSEPKTPSRVKQARKIVNGWDKHVADLRRVHDAANRKAFEETQRTVHFGTPAEALAAVDAFENSLRGSLRT